MLSITNTTLARKKLWRTFPRTHDVRLRERCHCILLLMDGKRCAEIAHWFETLNEPVKPVRDFFCYLAGVKAPVRHLCALKPSEA